MERRRDPDQERVRMLIIQRSTLTAAVAGVFALAAAAAVAHPENPPRPRGTVYVTERGATPGTAAAFDAATGKVLWKTDVGKLPIGIVRPRGSEKVYTSDEGSNQMSVLDRRTGKVLRTIGMGPQPHHLMASRDGSTIYVGEFGHNQIGVIDTVTDQRVAGYVASPLADARTHAVWITRDGKDLYAANTRVDRTQKGDVAKIDARTGRLECNVEVGADPSEILVRPGGRVGYVSVRREDRIKELDLRGPCPALTGREARVGTQPDTLQLTGDGDTLVVTLRGTPAQIALMDTRSFAVHTVDIPGHSTTGHHWLSADSRFTFVAAESAQGPGSVAVVDNEAAAVVADYPYPGGSRPHGVFAERSLLEPRCDEGDDSEDRAD
jgi:YVTN family beta-propeller protein